MTPQEINKEIHLWLGNEPINRYRDEADNLAQYPDYYNTSAAFDLLDVLIERGYVWIMAQDNKEATIAIYKQGELMPQLTMKAPTLSAAICEAIIALIEKEKEK